MEVVYAFLEIQRSQVLLESPSSQVKLNTYNKWRFCFTEMNDRNNGFRALIAVFERVLADRNLTRIDVAEGDNFATIIRSQTSIEPPTLFTRIPDRERVPVTQDAFLEFVHSNIPDRRFEHGERCRADVIAVHQ